MWSLEPFLSPTSESATLLSYNIIRPDTNFLTSSPESAPSKIKTQRNGITCMQLTSPKVHLSQTIHDWHRPLSIVPYRAIIYASFSKRTQWRFTCPANRYRLGKRIYTRWYLPVCWSCRLFHSSAFLSKMERFLGTMSKNSCPALSYYMTEGWRLLRWGLGAVPAITYHCNAMPVHGSNN